MARKKVETDQVAELLGNVDIEETEVENEDVRPHSLSPEWNSYALGLFDQDELDEQGRPTVDGLRRVTEIAIGPIISSQAKVVQSACIATGFRSTVEFTIVIRDSLFGIDRTYTEAADVYPGNVNEEKWAAFPTAFAATRAEGRALRKALKLRKICASEEVSDKAPEDSLAEAPISDVQLKQIDNLCKRMNLDALKLLGMAKDHEGNLIKDYREITRNLAKKIIGKLNLWEENKNKRNVEEKDKVPAKLVGYVSEWRTED